MLIPLLSLQRDALRPPVLGLTSFKNESTRHVPLPKAGTVRVMLPRVVACARLQRSFIRGPTAGAVQG